LIDFTPLLLPTTISTPTLQTATTILHALRTSGFVYLLNHPIPPSLLARVFTHSATFFARSQHQKDRLAWTTPEQNRGYVAHGREKVSLLGTREEVGGERGRAGGGDLKESFEIGKDLSPGTRSVEEEEGEGNQWPDIFDSDDDKEGAAFRTTMREFFLQCQELHGALMRAIALGMGLEEGFFDAFVDKADNNLRLLHYPPVRRGVFRDGNSGNRQGQRGRGGGGDGAQVRAGEHSDYGSVTLLFQDGRGGLQVRPPALDGTSGEGEGDGKGEGEGEGKKGWVDVRPVEGTVVVNAGDLLARWSNDVIRSTKHRVVEPALNTHAKGEGEGEGEVGDVYPARYSVAYFCNPNLDSWIEALPGTWEGEKGGEKFEGVWSGEYLVGRLRATY